MPVTGVYQMLHEGRPGREPSFARDRQLGIGQAR
jgi:hypothetical protein